MINQPSAQFASAAAFAGRASRNAR
jgi:hypothetical protein